VTDDQTVQDRIKRIFSDQMNVDVASHDTDLLESQLLDSMGIVDLLLYIEQQFGVTIGLEELEIEDFRSIEKIADKVSGRLQAKNGTATPSHAV
jgi:acyl carrier protein